VYTYISQRDYIDILDLAAFLFGMLEGDWMLSYHRVFSSDGVAKAEADDWLAAIRL
jgi:hypothetical protein